MSTRFPILHISLRWRAWTVSGVLALLPALVASAAQMPLAGADEELDEIVVEGSPLWKMREQMRETEDLFYARFNQLNTNDDFDVHCALEAPLGTRLRSRVCRVAFQMDAEAAAARAVLTGDVLIDPETVRLERWDEFLRHALEVINSDPQLRRLARKREDMGKRYEAERKRQSRQRWWRK